MKLLICQSCGVVIRSKGKHCTGCGIQLALNAPTVMPNFPVERPPLAVRYSQDHLLLERVVTERQLSVLTLKPQITSAPLFDDGGEHYANSGGNGGYGENGGNGGNGGNGHSGGNGGSSPYATLQYSDPTQDPGNLASGFGWNNPAESPMTPAEGRFVDPNAPSSSPSQDYWNSSQQAASQAASPAQQEPPASSGFYTPGSSGDYYLKTARESVELIEEPEPPSQPINKAVEALSVMSLEDSSANLPALPSEVPAAQELEPQSPREEAPENRPQPAPITNPSMHLAGFGGHPGAAISIAIGAGVGALAGQMLKRSTPEPQSEPQAQPVAEALPEPVSARESVSADSDSSSPSAVSGVGGADGTDLSNQPSASRETVDSGSSLAGASSYSEERVAEPSGGGLATPDSQGEDFFESNKSELEDFFGPQSNAPQVDPMEMQSEEPPSSEEPVASQSHDPQPIAQEQPVVQPQVVQPQAVVEPQAASQPEPRKESTNFFGDDDGGFDFFSNPASAAARKAVFDDNAEPQTSDSQAVVAPHVEPGPQSEGKPAVTAEPAADTAQERPRVAMPKSLTASKTKLKVADDDETAVLSLDSEDKSDSDDEDDDKPKYKPPKRRNFSGDDAPVSPRKMSNKLAAAKKSDDDDDDDDDADETAGGALTWLEEDVKFAGLTVSRKTAGVLVGVGIFILVQLPGWFMSFANVATGGGGQQVAQAPAQGQNPFAMGQPGGAPGAGQPGQGMPGRGMPGQGMPGQGMPGQGAPGQAQQASFPNGVPVVGGKWAIAVMVGNQPFRGEMAINQNGSNFSGKGRDASGTFDINGALLPPDQMQFTKYYDQDSRHKYNAHNEIIEFQGKLIPEGGSQKAIGAYRTQKRIGSSFSTLKPAKIIPIRGQWQAQQQVVVASNPQGMPGGFQVPGMQSPGGSSSFQMPGLGGRGPLVDTAQPATGTQTIKGAQNFFLLVAGGFVAIGVFIFLFFLMLFGPSGKMNIWEKQKYIPSQFRPEHMKMVRAFGKPLAVGGTPFGKRQEWKWWTFWQPKFLMMPPDIRKANPHMLLIGGSDKGKTRLMASQITHDIKSEDRAVILIDSDGQLCDLIVEWISAQPEGAKYAKRVVLVDPTYKSGSLAYNPLEMPDDGDLQSASSAIVHGFKAIYTEPPGAQSQWNAQTANILRNAAMLLMANGRTLTDLPNLLQDNDFRDIMLEAVERKKSEKTEYITILETWNQYKKLARTDQWITWVEPILNRVGPMLSDGRIRPILTKPVSDLKLQEIIKRKQILIVKVSQGELDQNANLLGSLIVTGLQQAAMSLARENPNAERPVALYLDEMDSFIEKETIESITSETKRYQIGFCGSIKTFQHLPEDYRNQLIINMGTMAIFALSKKDGDMLGPQMFRVDGRKIKHQTIQNFFNKVNTSPQFELIMDEEKLNIDRIVGQEIQTYFCYRVGTVAGVFKVKAPDFKDMPKKKINQKLVEKMHAITDSFGAEKKKSKDKDKVTDKAS